MNYKRPSGSERIETGRRLAIGISHDPSLRVQLSLVPPRLRPVPESGTPMIHHGDLFDVLPTFEAESIDACVTDPPYGISFMGKQWDNFGKRVAGQREFQAWSERWAREILRVLKPGGYLLVFGAPRSYHRMASGLEDAGFEIRDCLSFLFGQGFPKNHRVNRDPMFCQCGEERTQSSQSHDYNCESDSHTSGKNSSVSFDPIGLPRCERCAKPIADGIGSALKPGWEPIVVARKPFRGSLTDNYIAHGTGGLNIDLCRIEGLKPEMTAITKATVPRLFQTDSATGTGRLSSIGRWPANVAFDEHAAAMLDAQSDCHSAGHARAGSDDPRITEYSATSYNIPSDTGLMHRFGDTGGASRFFFVAKPSRSERDMGCHDLDPKQRDESRKAGNPGGDNPRNRGVHPRGNHHPTVKPIELMRWLVRLVTPAGGLVLDPFAGSGSTGCACAFELVKFIGVEREAEYVEIAQRRIAACAPLFSEVPA